MAPLTAKFQKATRRTSKLRLALCGPSGSGKTYSALSIASGLGRKVAVIDTEYGSASLYADEFDFDALCLESFSPDSYVEAIHAAEVAGYDVIVIDSLSHAWAGSDGALEQVDNAKAKEKNSFTAWRNVTPKHNAMVDAIVRCKAHVIATMRSKVEYVLEDGGSGKKVPRKVGMAPVQRDGMEYEFTICGDLDPDHNLFITKSRCREFDNKRIHNPGRPMAERLLAWLAQGKPEVAPDQQAGAAEKAKAAVREQFDRQNANHQAPAQSAAVVDEPGANDVSPEERAEAAALDDINSARDLGELQVAFGKAKDKRREMGEEGFGHITKRKDERKAELVGKEGK